MANFRPKPDDYAKSEIAGKKKRLLSAKVYGSFDSSLLGLGDIELVATTTDAIAAVFDLQGFTHFCKQIEPQLSVPLFLNRFLNWLFEQIKAEMTEEIFDQGVSLYCPLPFFVKFMGDGLLVLWDASETVEVGRRNILVAARQICHNYAQQFVPTVADKVVDPPPILRCGIARGAVYSVGNGNDFVGSCINMAARLEKLPGVTFAFNRRGFDIEDKKAVNFFKHEIVIKKISIRGIGGGELIAILKDEYDEMAAADKRQFRDP